MTGIQVGGLHHVTAISGDPQRNVDFYVGVLGLRFVKKTVNQDEPFTYHLYYGDTLGRPGTALTFFPFLDAPPGRPGRHQVYETQFSVPSAAIGSWRERLEAMGVPVLEEIERFGQSALRFTDPDGLLLALVGDAPEESEPGWPAGPISAAEAIRAFAGVRLASAAPESTARVLSDRLGFVELGTEPDATRFAIVGAERAGTVDLLQTPPDGQPGTGTVHHVAFRVPDREALLAKREELLESGLRATPEIDRFYFRSVYFREPGGILFEIATDGPGFTADEDAANLGRDLKLTAAHEPHRSQIEAHLPPIRVPEVGGTPQ